MDEETDASPKVSSINVTYTKIILAQFLITFILV